MAYKNIDFQGGEYGNAVLTNLPIIDHDNRHYRMLRPHEQRGLLRVGVRIDGRELQFFDTHIDHRPDDAERVSNLAEIRELWSNDTTSTPWIVCGDFNDTPGSRTHGAATEMFVDSWMVVGDGPGLSYPSGAPRKRIDFVFLRRDSGLKPVRAWIVRSDASDHLPVIVDVELR